MTFVADTSPLITCQKLTNSSCLKDCLDGFQFSSSYAGIACQAKALKPEHIRQALKQYITVADPTIPAAKKVKLATLNPRFGGSQGSCTGR